MSKTIAVTGGAGFLGSHLCARLSGEQHRVLCIDNFCTGKIDNIARLLEQPNFRLIRADITELLEIDEPIDEIYHLACPASPYFYQQDPVATIKTNVLGTLRMLELATRCNATLLQASTSEIYGDPLEHPQTESYHGNVNPIGIRACYDEGKRAAETLCFDFQRQYGTKIKVVRIFNTYGPDMDAWDGRVIPNFILQALGSRPLTVYGDGSQTRSFCYVEDMADALVAMMQSEPGFFGPVNLGNPCECSMLELADKIIALTGSASEKVFLPLPKDDPRKRKPSIELARQKLGWTPETDFEQGLKKTIESFRKPVLSVIVPVYNAQAFLEPCVDSILNQSFESFELLLIDDGSTDSSGKLCDLYGAKDSRVRVVHKENEGVSSARALGLAHARGEYVAFADSDDLVSKSMYGKLMELLLKTGSEVACCNNLNFGEEEKFPPEETEGNDAVVYTATGEEAFRAIYLTKAGKQTNIILWNKVYKRELFNRIGYWTYKQRLPMQYFEDNLITPLVFKQAEKVALTSEKLYFYRQREGSLKAQGFGPYKAERAKIYFELAEICSGEADRALRDDLTVKGGIQLIKVWMEAKALSSDDSMREFCLKTHEEYSGLYPKIQATAKGKAYYKPAFALFRFFPEVFYFVFKRYYFKNYSGMMRRGEQ